MQKTIIKSHRGSAFFWHLLWLSSAVMFAFGGIYVYPTSQVDVAVFMLLIAPGYFLVSWQSETANDIVVFENKTLRLQIDYPFRKLHWAGRWSDIEQICHELYEIGDGDAENVYIVIKSVGVVRLSNWDLQRAQALGIAIGVRVNDERVHRLTTGISRRKLVSIQRRPLAQF